MTQVSIDWCGGDSYVLTDEHSASSYGSMQHYVDECWGPDPLGDWHGRNA